MSQDISSTKLWTIDRKSCKQRLVCEKPAQCIDRWKFGSEI